MKSLIEEKLPTVKSKSLTASIPPVPEMSILPMWQRLKLKMARNLSLVSGAVLKCSILSKVLSEFIVDPSNSGRKIAIRSEWENSTDEWHLGVFDMTKVFPDYLTSRMAKKNKEDDWSPEFNQALSKVKGLDTEVQSYAEIFILDHVESDGSLY